MNKAMTDRERRQKELDNIRYMALQIREVLEHKGYLSELEDANIGFAAAYWDWSTESGKAAEFRSHYEKHDRIIRKICKRRCGENPCALFYLINEDEIVFEKQVKGRRAKRVCNLNMEDIHKILEDGPYERKDD